MRVALMFIVALFGVTATACTNSDERESREVAKPQLPDVESLAKWSSSSREISTVLAFIESRIEVLGKPGASSTKISGATLDSARSDLAALQKTWAEANRDYSSARVDEAIAKADIVRRKSAELLGKLKVSAS